MARGAGHSVRSSWGTRRPVVNSWSRRSTSVQLARSVLVSTISGIARSLQQSGRFLTSIRWIAFGLPRCTPARDCPPSRCEKRSPSHGQRAQAELTEKVCPTRGWPQDQRAYAIGGQQQRQRGEAEAGPALKRTRSTPAWGVDLRDQRGDEFARARRVFVRHFAQRRRAPSEASSSRLRRLRCRLPPPAAAPVVSRSKASPDRGRWSRRVAAPPAPSKPCLGTAPVDGGAGPGRQRLDRLGHAPRDFGEQPTCAAARFRRPSGPSTTARASRMAAGRRNHSRSLARNERALISSRGPRV